MPSFGCTHAGGQTGHLGFGRLFERRLFPWSDDYLVAIAATMDERKDPRPPQLQPSLPCAGYTYLGQFIDHDLTSDRRLFSDPPAGDIVVNFRTPRFDLDSVYGAGPIGEGSDLYDGDRLRLNRSGLDFARRANGSAHIRDPRNDSNRLVSQLHTAFIRFHNRVVDGLPPGKRRFDVARHIVCRHYQWIVLDDFLPKIVGQGMVDAILGKPRFANPALKFIVPGPQAQVPLEFSAAAFRFGHSMVRNDYQVNTKGILVFTFDKGQPDGDAAEDLRGFRPLADKFVVDWRLFFRFPGSSVEPQQARPIDTFLAPSLFELPFKVACSRTNAGRQLPYRNLHRSEFDLGLPSGQQVALEMRRRNVAGAELRLLGIDIPITATGAFAGARDIGGTGISKAQLEQQLTADAPLWYYILKEAQHFHNGERLGTVGGRIVAEVIIGMMASDPNSILNSGWVPTKGEYGCREDSEYGMVDLLTYAGVAG